MSILSLLSEFSAYIGRLWRGQAYSLLETQYLKERESTSKVYTYYQEQIEKKDTRIAELEKLNLDLQDRILLIKGVPPVTFKPEKRPPTQRLFGPEAAIEAAIQEKRERHASYLANAARFANTPISDPHTATSEEDVVDDADSVEDIA